VSKKKNKFDLTHLVHQGSIKEGETLYFVSDPSKTCQVAKLPNGEFKIIVPGEKAPTTIHAFAQACLGTEPPEHASRWVRNAAGKTLYEVWHADDMAEAA
jgi:hypothetical protein